MEGGKGTTGSSKGFIRTDEACLNHRSAQTPNTSRNLPEPADSAASRPSPEQDPKRRRLALLRTFRERGIISDQAFRAQSRMQGAGSARLPGPSKLATPPSRRKTRWWRWMLPGLVLLNVAGWGVVGLKSLKQSDRSAAVAAALADTLRPKVDPNLANVHALGKAFRLGPYTYTIAGCKTAATLGDQFSPMRANQGDEYVVVTFSIRNDSTKPRVASIEAFRLQDANGAVYAACSQGAAVPRTQLTRGDLLLTEIQPGITKALAAAFEVPVASLKPPLKLLVFEQDLLGGHEATVYLQ
jgi:Domain of unknown function (DUF4352)